jgi:UrcA family protein
MFQLKTGYLAAVSAALLTVSGIAAASPTPIDEQPSTVVKYGDLDLSTQAGISTLYRRLSAAARQVCPLGDIRDLGEFSRSRACQTEAVNRALRVVGGPALALVERHGHTRG